METLEQRLLRNMQKDPASGCWQWIGRSRTSTGYGKLGFQWRTYKAHRAAWLTWRGEIPKGLSVLHRCDNPLCINPEHLFLGTQEDNVRDCISKGRYVGNPDIGDIWRGKSRTEWNKEHGLTWHWTMDEDGKFTGGKLIKSDD